MDYVFVFVVKIVVRKPEKKWPLGRLMSKWEYNIQMNLKEDCEAVSWILPAQAQDLTPDRCVHNKELLVPLKGRNPSSWATIGFEERLWSVKLVLVLIFVFTEVGRLLRLPVLGKSPGNWSTANLTQSSTYIFGLCIVEYLAWTENRHSCNRGNSCS